MKYYIKWFHDFGISVYPVQKFKKGFDLVLLFVTISIDYGYTERLHEENSSIEIENSSRE